jgi:hypothetical protein
MISKEMKVMTTSMERKEMITLMVAKATIHSKVAPKMQVVVM